MAISNDPNKKHFLYVLTVESEIFYCGYTQQQPEKRLKHHIHTSLNPTREDLINDAIRGDESAKRKMIRTAIEEGWNIEIKVMKEAPTYESLDENELLEELRAEGHLLTNSIAGSVWQPDCLPSNKVKKVERPYKPKKDEIEAIERLKKTTSPEEIQAFIDSFGFNFSNHKLTDWQKCIYTK